MPAARLLVVGALLSLLVAGCGGGSAPAIRRARHHVAVDSLPVVAPAVYRLESLADAYVAARRGEHGYGPTLRVDASPLTRSYILFALGAVPGRIVSARLRLYALSGSRTGFAAEPVRGLRASGQRIRIPAGAPRAPGRGAIPSPAFRSHVWLSVDVTRALRGDRGTVGLVLLPRTSTEIGFASAESGANAPRLVVHTAPAATAAAYRGPVVGGSGPVTVAAAGDIACDPSAPDFHGGRGDAHGCHMRATSDLLLRLDPRVVLTLGDNQYEDAAYAKFRASYAPTWGRVKAKTLPAIGNHEYLSGAATGYFRYFGAAAGSPTRGWYSFDLGAWHVVALNSECGYVGGCGPGSPEAQWLREDLAAHRARCTLAYWHESRFTSGQHGDAQATATLWNELARAHADILLTGHNHDYERFAPAGATGQGRGGVGGALSFQAPTPDPHGLREFVVGTGGRNLYGFPHRRLPGEVVRNDTTYGVLALTLRPTGYAWRFVPAGRGRRRSFGDAGSAGCH